MHKTKNQYIKYSRTELENYTNQPESCVQKINCVEPIRFSPTIFHDFQSAILRILSKKIGKYDIKLNGVVLDFRNTKVLNTQSGVRQDSAYSLINVETNFYVFTPRKGAEVTGVLKYINRLSMETVITLVIYRVFNVKVTVKGKVKQELEKNQEIKIRVKDFHFHNIFPFIEGEIVDTGILTNTKKLFDDTIDSGISESSLTSEQSKNVAGTSGFSPVKIKQERGMSVEKTSGSEKKAKKSRKRKVSTDDSDSDVPPKAKKVKSEPMSPEPRATTKIKLENTSDSDDSVIRSVKKSLSNTSAASKESKKDKKAKKKKHNDSDDDFETSLQNLLNSAIKSKH